MPSVAITPLVACTLAACGHPRYAHLAERPTLYVLPAAWLLSSRGNLGGMRRTWGIDGVALVIPPRLRRFVLAEWVKAGEESLPDHVLAARAAYTRARQLWAREHGFDVHAVNGTHPGADWWAFIALCAEQQRADTS